MKNTRRFAFFSPLIALILFPAVIAAFLSFKNSSPGKFHCVNIFFRTKEQSSPYIQLFSEDLADNIKRPYTNYRLTGSQRGDKDALTQLGYAISRLAQQRDTVNGVHIRIDDDTPFQVFISCYDMYKKSCPAFARPIVFLSSGNDIYVFYNEVRDLPAEDRHFTCGTI
jgi:hypothetical protein